MNRIAKIGLYLFLIPRPEWTLPEVNGAHVEPQRIVYYEGFDGEVSSLSAHSATPLTWAWVSSIR